MARVRLARVACALRACGARGAREVGARRVCVARVWRAWRALWRWMSRVRLARGENGARLWSPDTIRGLVKERAAIAALLGRRPLFIGRLFLIDPPEAIRRLIIERAAIAALLGRRPLFIGRLFFLLR